jgi:5'-nucleotidase
MTSQGNSPMTPSIPPDAPGSQPPTSVPAPGQPNAAESAQTGSAAPAGTSVSAHEQLELALPLASALGPAYGNAIPRASRVYCNRNLKLNQITWMGFDMDYTLAIYDQAAMDELSIRATLTKLRARGYPRFIEEIRFATEFPVRGLLIDKRFGHVLKMDRYKHVTQGYHGFRELSRDELRELYHAKKLNPATPRYHWVDTLYALSEVALYAALVEAHEQNGFSVDYNKLFNDIRECIDEAHRDGTILDAITNDLPRYVKKDPALATTLHKWRSAGKKLFVLTNSRWEYTEKMMTYLLGDAMEEYPSWRNFFDIVIVAARKPSFFQEPNPLLEHDSGKTRPARLPLERGRIYEAGNVHDLEQALNVQGGDEVLYVGDHIYGDILRSKKESAWRTAFIVQELDVEVHASESCKSDYALRGQLEELRDRLDNDLRYYQGRHKELSKAIEGKASDAQGTRDDDELTRERTRMRRAVEKIRERMRLVDKEELHIERRINERFHRYWGSLMKDGNEQSSFGAQVENYACVYTSRVSNFGLYSPQQHFRSPRDEMAHEIGE